MFKYKLPDGGLRTRTTIINGTVKFEPAVYEQRYSTVLRILQDPFWKMPLKRIVEYGCGEMRLVQRMRRLKDVEHIVQVDIDENVLVASQHNAAPLISDFIGKLDKPLRIEVYRGNVVASVDQVRNTDAVVAIELIEHLDEDVLKKLPATIFGFVQPKLFLVTTPNSDFNVLFTHMLANGFRHLDHKFEFSRKEFRNWCLEICRTYPNYKVSIMGVGEPPLHQTNVGHSTQVAIFARRDLLGEPLQEPIKTDLPAEEDPDLQFKEIYAVDFPFDDRTKEQKIWDHVQARIALEQITKRFFNSECRMHKVPMEEFMEYIQKINATQQDLLDILKEHDVKVEDDKVLFPPDEQDESYFYDDTYGWDGRNFYHRTHEEDEEWNVPESNYDVEDVPSEEDWD